MALPVAIRTQLSTLIDGIDFASGNLQTASVRITYNGKVYKLRFNYWLDVEGKRQAKIEIIER